LVGGLLSLQVGEEERKRVDEPKNVKIAGFEKRGKPPAHRRGLK
jgi:hypothetical protein